MLDTETDKLPDIIVSSWRKVSSDILYKSTWEENEETHKGQCKEILYPPLLLHHNTSRSIFILNLKGLHMSRHIGNPSMRTGASRQPMGLFFMHSVIAKFTSLSVSFSLGHMIDTPWQGEELRFWSSIPSFPGYQSHIVPINQYTRTTQNCSTMR